MEQAMFHSKIRPKTTMRWIMEGIRNDSKLQWTMLYLFLILPVKPYFLFAWRILKNGTTVEDNKLHYTFSCSQQKLNFSELIIKALGIVSKHRITLSQ